MIGQVILFHFRFIITSFYWTADERADDTRAVKIIISKVLFSKPIFIEIFFSTSEGKSECWNSSRWIEAWKSLCFASSLLIQFIRCALQMYNMVKSFRIIILSSNTVQRIFNLSFWGEILLNILHYEFMKTQEKSDTDIDDVIGWPPLISEDRRFISPKNKSIYTILCVSTSSQARKAVCL